MCELALRCLWLFAASWMALSMANMEKILTANTAGAMKICLAQQNSGGHQNAQNYRNIGNFDEQI